MPAKKVNQKNFATLLLLLFTSSITGISCRSYRLYSEREPYTTNLFFRYKNGTYFHKQSTCGWNDTSSGTWVKNGDTLTLNSFHQPDYQPDSVCSTFDSLRRNKIIILHGPVKTISLNGNPETFELKTYLNDSTVWEGPSLVDDYAIILPSFPVYSIQIKSFRKHADQLACKSFFEIPNPKDNVIEIFSCIRRDFETYTHNEKWLLKKSRLYLPSSDGGRYDDFFLQRIRFLAFKRAVVRFRYKWRHFHHH
jgi:hypothetical protein